MKNRKNVLLIFIILCVVSTVVAASSTVMTQKNSVRGTLYTIALCMYAALALLALFDIVRSRNYTGRQKLLWSLLVLAGNVLGVLIYLLIGRKELSDTR